MIDKSHTPSGQCKRGITKVGMLPVVAIAFLVMATGCTTFNGVMAPYTDLDRGCCKELRANLAAGRIWRNEYAECYGNNDSTQDIKNGFIDGFVDCALGRYCCTPPGRTENYCKINKMLGRKTNTHCWLQGYPLGVIAAEVAGVCRSCNEDNCAELSCCVGDQAYTTDCESCQSQCGCGQTDCPGDCDVPAIPNDYYSHDDDGVIILGQEDQDDQPQPEPEFSDDADVEPDMEDEHIPEAPETPTDEEPESNSDVLDRDVNEIGNLVPIQNRKSIRNRDGQTKHMPTVNGPVELPNIQVSFDMDSDAWLFGDVDVRQAILEQDVISQLHSKK